MTEQRVCSLMEKIKFMSEDMQEEAFYVLEQTTVNAVNYLLVADSEEDEAQCLILKETPSAEKRRERL